MRVSLPALPPASAGSPLTGATSHPCPSVCRAGALPALSAESAHRRQEACGGAPRKKRKPAASGAGAKKKVLSVCVLVEPAWARREPTPDSPVCCLPAGQGTWDSI